MLKQLSLSHVTAGVTAVVVGYSSAVVLVIQAAQTAGATPAMITSWLLALGIGMGLSCIVFSWWYKVPVVTAWSTPGAAFLIGAVGGYPLNEVIGAFLLAGICSLLVAQSRWLQQKISAIPDAISSAMLAGIILPVCLNIFADVSQYPLISAIFLLTYIVGYHFFPRYMMLCLLALAIVTGLSFDSVDTHSWVWAVAMPVWVTPSFSVSAAVSLALPLFLITQLSQNLPGMAILKAHNYQPRHQVVLSGLAVLQIVTAPFGGFSYNYAAITAAICMGESAGSERSQRFRAAIVAGVVYVLMGFAAALVVQIFVAMPEVIVHLLAGLALVATLQSALVRSMDNHAVRHPALLTLVCTASGMSLFQLGAPVWGLALGLALLGVATLQQHSHRHK